MHIKYAANIAAAWLVYRWPMYCYRRSYMVSKVAHTYMAYGCGDHRRAANNNR